ncbi:Sec-independent protein translocase subunit TatA [Actinomadura scrupuli]|uniref:Sec-independent protein translocase subunit TatA n=1 Tax=Actinomadura scrupuli TaxID=559629 RepID=UPI003D973836
MTNFGTTELLIILVVLVLLFGSTKLPQLARSLGKSARILKAETRGLYDDDTDQRQAAPTTAPAEHPGHGATPGGTSPGPNALPPGRLVQEVPLPDSSPRRH